MKKILKVASISSLWDAGQALVGSHDERDLLEFAAAALSCWDQGLISCESYADHLEETAAWLRDHQARARRV
jgi:hypothetical protein